MKTIELQVMELFDAVRSANQKAYSETHSKIDSAERHVFDFLKAQGIGISEEAIAEAWKRLHPY